MNVVIESGAGQTQVSISGGCTIFEAADLRAQLLPLADSSGLLVVNLAAISEIDTAGVQVLLALQKQTPLTLFTGPAAAVVQALDLLNLNRCFSIEA